MPVDTTRIQIKDTKVFLMPEGLSGARASILTPSLYMGELLKKRFEPSQAFAMVLKKRNMHQSSIFQLQDEADHPLSEGRDHRD
ncbi:MAG: RsmF rRNA methyltransferase first C-terminal domain-containing protein [Clostridia bacterium]